MMILNWLNEIRSYLTSYGQYIRFRWLIPLIWAVAIAAMIWFYGENLALGTWRPFEQRQVRLIAALAVFTAWLVYLVVKLVRTRRADRKLVDAVTGGTDPARDAADDVAELRTRLRDALKTLRKTLGRGSVYCLPWYVLVGAPGAGKTTALVNSGLNFPLSDADGPHAIQGVAGTRYCDWWFTDDAILIDTAGRYTSQSDEQEVDKSGWKGFLQLLRKHRPRQPLNGALVMMGLDDLMDADPAERLRQGRLIRKRLRELDEAFRLRVPAYVVLTKTDRLAGFSAFFEHLDRSTREQVWGVTLPLPTGGIEGGDLADRFRDALDGLVERLNTLLLDRLQAETDPERRAEIFAFPSQVAHLAEPLHELLGEIAAASRFDPPPRIRGIYFASAQQDEAPVDMITRNAVAEFGLELPRLAEVAIPGTKSFFLARLLREVVFGEASLISTDPRRDRRNRIIRWAGIGAMAVVVLAVCAWWAADYLRQQDRLAATDARLSLYAADAAQIPVKDVKDRDFARIAHVLDKARAVSQPFGEEAGVRWALPNQRDKVMSGYQDLYGRALNDFLLPRLMLQVEADMQMKPEEAAYVADAVRIYPMLGSRTRMEPDVARKVLGDDFGRVLAGDDKADLRASLDRHIASLVAAPLTPIATDDALIRTALANEAARNLFVKWEERGGKTCVANLTGRYPFTPNAAQEMGAADFKALFGPGGAFDGFFKDELQDKIDTTASPWKWKEPGRAIGGIAAFERAAAIRTAFFGGPGNALSISFDVTPQEVDGAADAVAFNVDGQEVTFARGSRAGTRPVALTWPGSSGLTGAALTFQPAGSDSVVTRKGLWALFRVLDTAAVQAVDSEQAKLVFRAPDRSATFEFRVNAASNPFDLKALRAFRCPTAF